MQSYIRRLDNPKGRWNKLLEGTPKRLSLGSYMILANLGCVMKECLGSDEFDGETDRAVRTVMKLFHHPELKVLFENVNPDGTFDLESCEGRFVNPGHGLESMWFVLQYAERINDRELIRQACDYVGELFPLRDRSGLRRNLLLHGCARKAAPRTSARHEALVAAQ